MVRRRHDRRPLLVVVLGAAANATRRLRRDHRPAGGPPRHRTPPPAAADATKLGRHRRDLLLDGRDLVPVAWVVAEESATRRLRQLPLHIVPAPAPQPRPAGARSSGGWRSVGAARRRSGSPSVPSRRERLFHDRGRAAGRGDRQASAIGAWHRHEGNVTAATAASGPTGGATAALATATATPGRGRGRRRHWSGEGRTSAHVPRLAVQARLPGEWQLPHDRAGAVHDLEPRRRVGRDRVHQPGNDRTRRRVLSAGRWTPCRVRLPLGWAASHPAQNR